MSPIVCTVCCRHHVSSNFGVTSLRLLDRGAVGSPSGVSVGEKSIVGSKIRALFDSWT